MCARVVDRVQGGLHRMGGVHAPRRLHRGVGAILRVPEKRVWGLEKRDFSLRK